MEPMWMEDTRMNHHELVWFYEEVLEELGAPAQFFHNLLFRRTEVQYLTALINTVVKFGIKGELLIRMYDHNGLER